MVKHLEAQILGTVDDMAGYPIVVARGNSDLQVINTTTETEILEYTVPANFLSGDHGFRVTLDFFTLNNSGGSLNYQLRIKLGATTMWDSGTLGATDPGAATENNYRLQFEVMAKNSDAIQELFGRDPNSSSAIYGEATEDGTTDLVLAVTVDLATADAAFECTRRRFIVEYL